MLLKIHARNLSVVNEFRTYFYRTMNGRLNLFLKTILHGRLESTIENRIIITLGVKTYNMFQADIFKQTTEFV